MAFFDSPKNMALWDKELEGLDAEKERRRTNGYRPGQKREKAPANAGPARNPYVRRINLRELMEIERLSRESNDGGNVRERRKGRVQENRKSKTHGVL